MKGKRTGIDFSEHEILVTEQEGLLVHYLCKPNTVMDSIKYINTNGILAVTGDYGNWIFCREFHPSAKGGVSDSYWAEKLQIASVQKARAWDGDATKARLYEELAQYKLECEEEQQEPKEEVIEYYEGCINECDSHEVDYTHYAYGNIPDNWDSESVVFEKEYHCQLKYVFDGFDEICRRMKEQESAELPKETTLV